MNVFESAKWIWLSGEKTTDQYAEFEDSFCPSEEATLRISCDGDYTLWVNGAYASSGQYGDFEHYKIYDTVDLSPWLVEGENRIRILVWHFGVSSQRYFPAPAGLIYEITEGDRLLAGSSKRTGARLSPVYQSGRNKKITGQLGLGFAYNATAENCGLPFLPAEEQNKHCTFFPLPIKKHLLENLTEGRVIRKDGPRILFDLGKECVGLLSLRLTSSAEQNLHISFGEHLNDEGWAPRIIDSRDFSVEYRAKKGENEYTNYMLRFGCRFLEIEGEAEISDCSVGIRNQTYPISRVKAEFAEETDRRIYELCVNTLEKCMMEHYVDCPWREQNLYAFDSRNQMLCGYRVFEGGNKEYARANLKLFSQDRREDGLLSICTPCGSNLTIPSFSLYYVIAVWEYVRETKDITLISEVYPKLTELVGTFLYERKDELVYRMSGKEHWNFYDWTDFCEGTLGTSQEPEPDAIINCLLILALDSLERCCSVASLPFPWHGEADKLRSAVRKAFFCTENGLITLRNGREEYTELANSLAILADILTGEEAVKACEQILAGNAVPCSLSMRSFKYDALLKTDKNAYLPHVLSEIRRDYKTMLDAGSDCAWETVDGASAFHNAGSLCHGWSAVPVLYLPQIKK